MKRQLLDWLRCLECRSELTLEATATAGNEVVDGTLTCTACGRRYGVAAGVPRMIAALDPARRSDRVTAHTAEMFGYAWSQTHAAPIHQPRPWHYAKMERALELAPIAGLVLDAGCGDGVDLANQALRPGTEVIGVELSDGGVRKSWERVAGIPRAHVVQADLCRLPFDAAQFDWVYSYGVLHHISTPPAAVGEIARVAKPSAPVAVYLYEDFIARGALLRWALRAANSLRALTTRMPAGLLYACCRAASPLVYATFTVPHKILRAAGATGLANAIPFRHGTHPFGLTGDLYDRFSAPVELRYTRPGAEALLRDAGLEVSRVANDRGWMLAAHRASRISA
jgi:SAM-dependent methyltransferase